MALLVASDGSVDVEATSAVLLDKHPELGPYRVKAMVDSVCDWAFEIDEKAKKPPQYLWLFYLAGRLKGLVDQSLWEDEGVAEDLSPFAYLFAELVVALGLLIRKNRIDWLDQDAVQIEWLQAWAKRRLPLGSSALVEAIEYAKDDPLGIGRNRYFAMVVNMGHFLQKRNGSLPFIIPVNARLASSLGTTAPTLGSAVAKAIREGFFVVEESEYNASARKARLLRFNFERLEQLKGE